MSGRFDAFVAKVSSELMLEGAPRPWSAARDRSREAFRGEYWWTGRGGLLYADGDVCDRNHESFAIEEATRRVCDAIGTEKPDDAVMLSDAVGMDPRKVVGMLVSSGMGRGDAEGLVEIATGGGDPREFAVENFGWIRSKGISFDVPNLSRETLSSLAEAIDDILDANGELEVDHEELVVDIYNAANGRLHSDVPVTDVVSGDVMSVAMEGTDGSLVVEDIAAETWIRAAGAEGAVRKGLRKLHDIYDRIRGIEKKTPEERKKRAVEDLKKVAEEEARRKREKIEYLERIRSEYKDASKIPAEETAKTIGIIKTIVDDMPVPVSDSDTVQAVRERAQRRIVDDLETRKRILEIMGTRRTLLADRLAAVYLILFGTIYFDWEEHAVPIVARGMPVRSAGVDIGKSGVTIPYRSWKEISGR